MHGAIDKFPTSSRKSLSCSISFSARPFQCQGWFSCHVSAWMPLHQPTAGRLINCFFPAQQAIFPHRKSLYLWFLAPWAESLLMSFAVDLCSPSYAGWSTSLFCSVLLNASTKDMVSICCYSILVSLFLTDMLFISFYSTFDSLFWEDILYSFNLSATDSFILFTFSNSFFSTGILEKCTVDISPFSRCSSKRPCNSMLW